MTYGRSHPGKWIRAVEVNPSEAAFTGSFHATGSYAGAGGIIVGVLPAPNEPTGSITLTGGEDPIDVAFLKAGEEYNFSVQHVSMSMGRVWVLYKNPIAHF